MMNIQGRDSDIKYNVCPSDRQLALRAKYVYLYDNINFTFILLTCLSRLCCVCTCARVHIVSIWLNRINRQLNFIKKSLFFYFSVCHSSFEMLTHPIHAQPNVHTSVVCLCK